MASSEETGKPWKDIVEGGGRNSQAALRLLQEKVAYYTLASLFARCQQLGSDRSPPRMQHTEEEIILDKTGGCID